jgi:hypothetical protein
MPLFEKELLSKQIRKNFPANKSERISQQTNQKEFPSKQIRKNFPANKSERISQQTNQKKFPSKQIRKNFPANKLDRISQQTNQKELHSKQTVKLVSYFKIKHYYNVEMTNCDFPHVHSLSLIHVSGHVLAYPNDGSCLQQPRGANLIHDSLETCYHLYTRSPHPASGVCCRPTATFHCWPDVFVHNALWGG